MVTFAFKTLSFNFEGSVRDEAELTEYAKSLGATSDGERYNLIKRKDVALIKQHAQDLEEES